MKRSLVLILILITSCGKDIPEPVKLNMNSAAEKYIILCHKLGIHDGDYVDAYFGPDSLKTIALNDTLPLRQIKVESIALQRFLDTSSFDDKDQFRAKFMSKMLTAMQARINNLIGHELTFEEEADKIFNTVAPKFEDEHFDKILVEFNDLLPGKASLNERYNEFKSQFIIPSELVDTVFRAALNESRMRTLNYVDLPDNENFRLEYVTGKSWSGYNWYQGNAESLVQINLDQPVYIDRAIDLASHEAYPGHHTFHSTMESKFVKENAWVEFTIYPLFSPLSLVSEGHANFGIEMAFPGDEKIKFEKEVLFPLAGLDPSTADKFYQVQELVSKLNFSGNEAARNYLNGDFTREQAIEYLMKYNMMTASRAEQRMNFIDQYRGYVINYNVGLEKVRNWVEKNSNTDQERWDNYIKIMEEAMLASELEE